MFGVQGFEQLSDIYRNLDSYTQGHTQKTPEKVPRLDPWLTFRLCMSNGEIKHALYMYSAHLKTPRDFGVWFQAFKEILHVSLDDS
jgi:hypothetical protein